MSKKNLIKILIIFLMPLLSVCIFGCTKPFEEKILPLDESSARVEKTFIPSFNADGISATGLYALAFDKLTITLNADYTNKCSVVLSSTSSNIESLEFLLDSESNEFEVPFDGLITLKLKESFTADKKSPFIMTISGGMQTPYFVLNKTSIDEWSQIIDSKGELVHFSADNLHIVFDKNEVDLHSLDPQSILSYYSTVIQFQNSLINSNTSQQIYFDNSLSLNEVSAKIPYGITYFSKEKLKNVLDIDNVLKNGEWNLFYELSKQIQFREHNGNILSPFTLETDYEILPNVFAFLTTQKLTNVLSKPFNDDNLEGFEKFLNPLYALEVAKSRSESFLDYADFSVSQRFSFYVLLAHRFGAEGYTKLLADFPFDESANEKLCRDLLLTRLSEQLGYDFSEYFDFFKMNNSFAAKEQIRKQRLRIFYPVFSSLCMGDVYIKNENVSPISIDFSLNTQSLFGDIEIYKIKVNKDGYKPLATIAENTITFMPQSKQVKIDLFVSTPSETVKMSAGYLSADSSTLREHFLNIDNLYGSSYMRYPLTIIYTMIISGAVGFILFPTFFAIMSRNKRIKAQRQKTRIRSRSAN